MFDEEPSGFRWLPTVPIAFERVGEVSLSHLGVTKLEIDDKGNPVIVICQEGGGWEKYFVRVVRLPSGNAGFYSLGRNDVIQAFQQAFNCNLVSEEEREAFEALHHQQNPPPKADFPLH